MELIEKIQNAGVVGAGGAGFPTHMKLNCQVEYLLINAAECEPLLHTDKHIMNTQPKEVVTAVSEVGKLVGAREMHIAVKAVNTKEIQSLQNAIQEMNSDVKIFPLDNYYPAGDEQMIVYDITGRTVPPGGIPLQAGAVVSNVATMLHIYDAMLDRPVTHKYLTVTGEVNRPTVLRVPIGTSFRNCIEAAGGSRLSRYLIVNGGPMMGQIYTCDDLDKLSVTKTTSGILVLKESDHFIARLKFMDVQQILNRAKTACIQCSFCTELCPRNLIGHKIRPHMVMRQMASVDFKKEFEPNETSKEALLCCECGVCETFACPMNLSPRQVNKFVKQKLAGTRYQHDGSALTASPLREYRKVAPKRIMARMGLSGLYNYKVNDFQELSTQHVTIPLRQHIGVPAAPVVAEGDQVVCGQLIGAGDTTKPSANIHASIDGRVIKVGDTIEIKGGI